METKLVLPAAGNRCVDFQHDPSHGGFCVQAYQAGRSGEFYGPGGRSDIFARAIVSDARKIIPQRLQVVNKSGGGSAVAMAYLARKKGDTHTIGFHWRLGYQSVNHRCSWVTISS